MVLLLHGPFAGLAGKQVVLPLGEPLKLRQVIARLAEAYPGFRPHLAMASDAMLSAHISFLRRGRVLRLDEPVVDTDTLHALLPVSGG